MCAVILNGVAMCDMFENFIFYDFLFFINFSTNV